MDIQEKLKFCDVCTNRDFNPQMGIVCKLSGKQADFDLSCAHYTVDPMEAARVEREENMTGPIDLNGNPIDESSINNLPMAILGGSVAALIGALIWGFITVVTGYQIGYLAIGVGFLVGIAVRFFGKGIDTNFAILGATLAFVGIVIGNLFSIIGIAADELGTSVFGVMEMIPFATVIDVYFENFGLLDIVFYLIAISTAFKYSLAIKQ